MQAYVAENYVPQQTRLTVWRRDQQVIFSITSVLKNKRAMSNGQWTSWWSYDGGALNGRISVVVHLFDEGNVQMRFTQAIDKHNATELVRVVKRAEVEASEGLQRHLDGLSDETFKRVRRALPITRTKLDWYKGSL